MREQERVRSSEVEGSGWVPGVPSLPGSREPAMIPGCAPYPPAKSCGPQISGSCWSLTYARGKQKKKIQTARPPMISIGRFFPSSPRASLEETEPPEAF